MTKQHVQVPNSTTKNVTSEVKNKNSKKHYTDLLVYACLRKHMDKDSKTSQVSLRKISDETGLSLTGIQSAIKRLIDNNDIEKSNAENKGANSYKFNSGSEKFEMYDKEFLENKELSTLSKSFMIAVQPYLYVDKGSGIAKTTFNTKEISDRTGLSKKVVNERIKELEISGFISKRLTEDKYGNSCEAIEFNLPKFGQHVLYKLEEHDIDIKQLKEKSAAQEMEINKLKYMVKQLAKNNPNNEFGISDAIILD